MRFLAPVGLALACALPTSRVDAQIAAEAIALGGTTLRLGMPREAVEGALQKSYSLKPVPSGEATTGPADSLMVLDGKTAVGNVAFRNGRLSLVLKYWDPPEERGTGIALAQKFYGAVGSLVRDGHRSCTLESDSFTEPQAARQVATIRCGRRSLELSVWRSDQHGEWVNLLERLQ
jgi:hypothetical protein